MFPEKPELSFEQGMRLVAGKPPWHARADPYIVELRSKLVAAQVTLKISTPISRQDAAAVSTVADHESYIRELSDHLLKHIEVLVKMASAKAQTLLPSLHR